MIIAIQAGDKDKDPAQTGSHMKSILEKISDAGDSVIYVDQPSTMSDQIQPVADDLGLDVIKVTPEFMLHGLGAVEYALTQVATRSDVAIILGGSEELSTIDRDFQSYVVFFGHPYVKTVVPYERIEVL